MSIQAVENILSLLILIAVGYFASGRKWFGNTGGAFLSKLVSKVTLPCFLANNIYTSFDTPQELLDVVVNLPLPFLLLAVMLGAGVAICRAVRVSPARQGVFINAFTFGNSVLVGFPVTLALLGQEALPYAMVYYMANTITFWSVGMYLLRRDSGERTRFFSLDSLRKIFSLPILALIVGIALVLLDVTLPTVIASPLRSLGSVTSPLAMIFIGHVIRQADLRSLALSKELLLVLVSRYLLSPLTATLVCFLLPMGNMMRRVVMVMSIMPAMTQLSIMSKETGSDYEYASLLVAVTSIISMCLLPLFALALEHFALFPV